MPKKRTIKSSRAADAAAVAADATDSQRPGRQRLGVRVHRKERNPWPKIHVELANLAEQTGFLMLATGLLNKRAQTLLAHTKAIRKSIRASSAPK